MAASEATLEIFRYRPDDTPAGGGDPQPSFDTYKVPYREDWVVLDAINYVKDHLDGTLSYRWSCRMGVCGSCGMMINGTPRLTCAAFLKEWYPAPIRIEPLTGFPVVRDLVINMEDFMDKLQEVKAWLIPKEERTLEQGEYRQTPAQLAAYKDFSMCINCMLCYAACPVYAMEPKFLGPAAIALGQRYNMDSRDKGEQERAHVLWSDEGIWECTFVGDCTRVCPADVDPAAAIQEAKVIHTKSFFRNLLLPGGKS